MRPMRACRRQSARAQMPARCQARPATHLSSLGHGHNIRGGKPLHMDTPTLTRLRM